MRLVSDTIQRYPTLPPDDWPITRHLQATTGRWTDIIWWHTPTVAIQHVYYIDGTVAVREYRP